MINTVKLQESGYLLNNNMSVPKADGNSEYEAIKLWLAEGNIPEPQYTQLQIDAVALAEEVQVSLSYLASTDHKFLVGYKAKEGEDLVAIEAARDVAREFIRNSGV